MAEEEAQEQPKAKKPILLILVVAVLAVGAGAGGAFFFLGGTAPPSAAAGTEEGEAGTGEGEPESEQAAGEEFQERVLSLDPFITNITGDGYARLLKMRIDLECDSVETRDEATARSPQLRDSVLTLLSSKRLADITGFEGKSLLKDDLRERMNQVLTTGQVRSVLITEFVVQ